MSSSTQRFMEYSAMISHSNDVFKLDNAADAHMRSKPKVTHVST
jgi:hypothetical protein